MRCADKKDARMRSIGRQGHGPPRGVVPGADRDQSMVLCWQDGAGRTQECAFRAAGQRLEITTEPPSAAVALSFSVWVRKTQVKTGRDRWRRFAARRWGS